MVKLQDAKIFTGDLIAFHGNSFASGIIAKWGGIKNWFWNGKWEEDHITHVGLAIRIVFEHEWFRSRLCILESHAFKGVRLNPLDLVVDQYKRAGASVYWQALNSPDIRGEEVASRALQNWTKAYPSWRQFLVAGSSVSQWFRGRSGRAVDLQKDAFHCSELVTRALIDSGYKHKLDPAVTTPQMVSNFDCFGTPVHL